MKKLVKERELLKEAIHDLEGELKSLRKSKGEFEEKLRNDSAKLDFVKSEEIRLRSLISSSLKKEAELLKKRDSVKSKLIELNQKIEKVRSIERELQEV